MYFIIISLCLCSNKLNLLQNEMTVEGYDECGTGNNDYNSSNLIIRTNNIQEWTNCEIDAMKKINICAYDYNFNYIPDQISRFKNVNSIIVSSDQFVKFSDEVGKLSNLRSLQIGSYTIDEIDKSIKNLKNLKELCISNDKNLKYFEDEIKGYNTIKPQNEIQQIIFKEGEFEKLEELSIKIRFQTINYVKIKNSDRFKAHPVFHYLKNIPDEICNLKKLEKIKIVDQEIQIIPKDIGNLTNLKFLDLSNNNILCLPNSIGNLTVLKELFLKNHNFQHINENISNLKNLKILDLQRTHSISSYNQVDKYFSLNFSKLKNLKYLNLNRLNLERIHKTILDLQNNDIEIFLRENNLSEDDEGEYVGKKTLKKKFNEKIHF